MRFSSSLLASDSSSCVLSICSSSSYACTKQRCKYIVDSASMPVRRAVRRELDGHGPASDKTR